MGNSEKTKLKSDDKLIPFGEALFKTIAQNKDIKTLGDALKNVSIAKMQKELKPFNEILSKKIGERLIEEAKRKNWLIPINCISKQRLSLKRV